MLSSIVSQVYILSMLNSPRVHLNLEAMVCLATHSLDASESSVHFTYYLSRLHLISLPPLAQLYSNATCSTVPWISHAILLQSPRISYYQNINRPWSLQIIFMCLFPSWYKLKLFVQASKPNDWSQSYGTNYINNLSPFDDNMFKLHNNKMKLGT